MPKFTDEELALRRWAADQAAANSAIEGHVPTPEFTADMAAWAAGELTGDQVRERTLARLGVERPKGTMEPPIQRVSPLTASEVVARRVNCAQAMASCRIDGAVFDDEDFLADQEEYIQGFITNDERRRRVLARLRAKQSKAEAEAERAQLEANGQQRPIE